MMVLLVDDEMMDEWEFWVRVTLRAAEFRNPAPRPTQPVVPVMISDRTFVAGMWARSLNYLEPETRPLVKAERLHNRILATTLDYVRQTETNYPVFVCYSRQDRGTLIDGIESSLNECPRLEPFLDEHDLIGGVDFHSRFDQVIHQGALLVVWTDHFSSRSETIRELMFAKQASRPIVVLSHLNERDPRAFPYLGNAPIITPSKGSNGIDHALGRTVLNEILCHELAKMRVEAEALKLSSVVNVPVISVARPPDVVSLSKELPDPPRAEGVCLYPDPPLTPLELDILSEHYPKVLFLTPVQCGTHEASLSVHPNPSMKCRFQPLAGKKVQLTISSPGPEALRERGLGDAHVETVVIEFARHLISSGACLVSSGSFGSKGLGQALLQVQGAYGRGLNQLDATVQALFPLKVYERYDDEMRKELGRVLDYRVDDLPEDVRSGHPSGNPQDEVESRIVLARSLTETRRKIADKIDACVVVGGVESGFEGRYADALEAALFAVMRNKPIYLVGLLGGASRSIFEVVAGGTSEAKPLVFDEAAQRSDEQHARFHEAYNKRYSGELSINYHAIHDTFHHLTPAGLATLNLLSPDENVRLADPMNLGESLDLVMEGLTRSLHRAATNP
jgi:hypothetical protein